MEIMIFLWMMMEPVTWLNKSTIKNDSDYN